MKINTKFNLNQRIYIIELKCWGKIKTLFYDGEIFYKVRYFDNKDPKEVYFLEDELSDKEINQSLGFSAN